MAKREDDVSERIITILGKSKRPLRAKDIAKRLRQHYGGRVDTGAVNQCLYSDSLRSRVRQDSEYRWSLRSDAPTRIADQEKLEIDGPSDNGQEKSRVESPEDVPDSGNTAGAEMPGKATEEARRKFDEWKRRLLDLSGRNRLLHFRKTRRSTLTLDEVPVRELFSVVACNNGAVGFLPKPEQPDLSPAETDNIQAARRGLAGCALCVQTPVSEPDLHRTLTNLYRKSNQSVAEQGVHTLYLACGFMTWFEASYSDDEIRSPLVLVPVEIERRRGGRFVLKATGEAIEANMVLAEKLRQDFNLNLPEWDPEEETEKAFNMYLDAVGSEITDMPRWSVTDNAVLGIFSFHKLVMYRDLEKHAECALAHPFVKALCGDPPSVPDVDIPTGAELDKQLGYADTFHVLDADSSQREAIAAATRGQSFVMIGPPGTGKSQTIANILAEMIATGKNVLFVSEKAAALQVVWHRLDECNLSEYCLDLHSRKGRTRQVLDQLHEELSISPAGGQARANFARAERCRRQLNDYVEALHEPFSELHLSPYDVHAQLATLTNAPELQFQLVSEGSPQRKREWPTDSIVSVTRGQLAEIEEALRDIEHCADVIKQQEAHPWWGYRYDASNPWDRLRLKEAIQELRQRISTVEDLGRELSDYCGLVPLKMLDEASKIARTAELVYALAGDTIEQSWLEYDSLQVHIDQAEEASKRVSQLQDAVDGLTSVYDDQLMEEDVQGLAERFRRYRTSWWRRVFASHRDRVLLRDHLLEPKKRRGFRKLVADVDCIETKLRAESWFGEHAEEHENLFGTHFRGRNSDWEALAQRIQVVDELRRCFKAQDMPHDLKALLVSGERPQDPAGDVQEVAMEIRSASERVAELLTYFRESFRKECDPFRAVELQGMGLDALGAWIDVHLEEFERIDDWNSFRKAEGRARKLGLGDFIEQLLENPSVAQRARDAFYRRFYLLWLGAAYEERAALRDFDLRRMDRRVREFRTLDVSTITESPVRVRNAVSARRPNLDQYADHGQVRVLEREFQKKRRHKPIRQLLAEIPELVQTLTPCMLMSPLTVSQYLSSERLHFDLVVFDEASQVRPEDAIPAIMRADQLIVAGDSQQLPPTNFFEASLSDDYYEDEALENLESVLNECLTWMPRRLLKWHYRSKDDTLIAFSNHEFYDNRLVTFPSPGAQERQLGVELLYCPDGVYDRGKSRKNRVEAARVVDLIRELTQSVPEDSLGVVALSLAQEEAIYDELERLTREAPDFERLLSDEDTLEPFFIKNLETVQGDERDIIILSIGYGPDQAGQLTMNFGPINREGGARRLNVAVTRAKKRMLVVSSIRAHDIAASASEGAQVLRRYLEYAERGPQSLATTIGTGTDEVENPFEEAVRDALVQRGLEIRPQVGCSGYRVDLAVVDPDRPGSYLLGIECDGRTYHSARTARDRDRLRQEVLEGLGWRIVRI